MGTTIGLSPSWSELEKFIARKKVIALGLTVLLLGVAVQRVIEFLRTGRPALNLNSFFYTDVFTVMIFTDVLIVILSLAVSDRYELVFRNGAFVISTILIRFSLTAVWPYGALLALMGMAVWHRYAADLQLPPGRDRRALVKGASCKKG